MAREMTDREAAELLGLTVLPPIDEPSSSVPEIDTGIGTRVRQARQRSGLSAAVVAQEAGLTPDKLSKIEHGKRRIAPAELAGLAQALKVSLAWLLDQATSSRSSLALAHRVSADSQALASSPARERAVALLEAEDRLARKVPLTQRRLSPAGAMIGNLVPADPPRYPDMPRTKTEARRQGRALAEEVRRVLELGSAGINDLPALIEMHFAADVLLSPLGDSSDGLCAHDAEADDHHALLVVNTDYPLGRTRFTLAHELGHHLLRDAREVIEEDQDQMYSNGYVEQRVNSFAGHLLLPVRSVNAALTWLDATGADLVEQNARGRLALGYLMVLHGVSMPCALQQVLETGVITLNQKQSLTKSLRSSDLVRAAAPLVGDRPGPEKILRQNRPPARLATAVIDAARSGSVGMNTVSVILGRPDDESLYDEVMFGPEAVPVAIKEED
ncbi:helix-turn-helix domain-containing protein [Kineosporia sp. J2-2]|uniref:Helix-turn-helix domain-containing protein n=1 Tax=Kineosporia corallincola TaxID=2835133 RepID=A0ABS5TGQ2_9ACTN|nr:helix-turn-helix domain-containing protein [Kineosporia corallincola]MBT0770270.1 helix-turn-helix domain-containing protein [Kineosporia corallincola]